MFRQFLAEFVGTFVLVLVGCGAACVHQTDPTILSHLGVAMAFGLAVTTMIYAVGDVSGAHLNPAVTVGFILSGRLDLRTGAFFAIAQTAGAVAAAALLQAAYADRGTDLGTTAFTMAPGAAFAIEAICTMILMFVILAVATGAKEKGMMAGVAIGAVVLMNAIWAGPLTGASMNPARSLGPALIQGRLEQIWLYLLAPVVGAAAAVFLCRAVHEPGLCCNEDGGCGPGTKQK
jgi:aquaporin NIP